ncbi:MAG TPA: sulfite exporter TauE/SafE family protein, partial [Opitutaceae bacterium]|nr:sulfite exporter TauE/SafE family protein [Opitutaceae bacterium]
SATQVLTGFGFGLVALAVIGAWLDLRDAVLVIAPAGLVLNVVLFLRFRKEFSFEGVVPLLISCLIGVPFGVWLLWSLGVRSLRVVLGVMMILTALHRLWMLHRKRQSVWHPLKAGVPLGFLSGVLGGAFGAGGPPVVSYLVNRPVNRFCYVATVQVAAGIASIVRLVQFTVAGRYERVDLGLLAVSVTAAVTGLWAGSYFLNKISEEGSKRAILTFILVGGFYYLIF